MSAVGSQGEKRGARDSRHRETLSTTPARRRAPGMGGLITFLVGASIAAIALAGWRVVRWRAGRAGGGRRW